MSGNESPGGLWQIRAIPLVVKLDFLFGQQATIGLHENGS